MSLPAAKRTEPPPSARRLRSSGCGNATKRFGGVTAVEEVTSTCGRVRFTP